MGILPPVATRLERAARVAFVLAMLCLPLPLIVQGSSLGGAWLSPVQIGFYIVAYLAIALFVLAGMRGKRRIIAVERRLCPKCLYDLRTLGVAGSCPERGRPYSPVSLEDAWMRAYGLPWQRSEPRDGDD